jgi:hypothetical protein
VAAIASAEISLDEAKLTARGGGITLVRPLLSFLLRAEAANVLNLRLGIGWRFSVVWGLVWIFMGWRLHKVCTLVVVTIVKVSKMFDFVLIVSDYSMCGFKI